MESTDTFKKKLEFGQVVEDAVQKQLKTHLTGFCVKRTEQEFGAQDRIDYCTADVVVTDTNGSPVCGIEVKRSATPYRLCKSKNGWDSRYNTPLNKSSLEHYSQASFPIYIININQFKEGRNILMSDVNTILHCNHDTGNRKKSGEVIYNFDCRSWKEYSGKVQLSDVLKDIILIEKERGDLC